MKDKIIKLHNYINKNGVKGIYRRFLRSKRKKDYRRLSDRVENLKIKNNSGLSDKFKLLYEAELETEIARIVAGERKILFYSPEDPNYLNDIKVRWELNRKHHLPVLAMSDDERLLSEEFEYVNTEEILLNTNAMEVGIAAVNVLVARQLNPDLDADIFLEEACKYILKNIEIGLFYSSNHYFFNLLSLLWILENAEINQNIQEVKGFIENELLKLLKIIINDDGSLYEGSVSYHKYVCESLMLFLYFNDDAACFEKLKTEALKMYQFCTYAAVADELVGIGDNDSGRILALPAYYDYDSHDISLIRRLATEMGFAGEDKMTGKTVESVNLSDQTSFGLFRLSNDNWDAFLRCDSYSDSRLVRHLGVHYHNDQLETLLFYCGEKLFVDTGTYSYVFNDDCRINNLKTSVHNTLMIDNREQSAISNDWNYTRRKARGIVMDKDDVMILARQLGYQDLGIVHQRKVELGKEVIITDTIINEGVEKARDIRIFYHLHPSFEVSENAGKTFTIYKKKDKIEVEISGECDVILEDSEFYGEYGKKEKNKRIVIDSVITEDEREKEIKLTVKEG